MRAPEPETLQVRRQAALLALVAMVWTLAAYAGAWSALLHFAPFLLILVPLLSGRYPGERLIARARARFGRKPPRPEPGSRPRLGRPRSLLQPGRLLANSLGGRAPPRPAALET